MEIATPQTNRIDSFCLEHLGDDRDSYRRAFIRTNFDWFRQSPTFWLKIGTAFVVPERPGGRRVRLADGSMATTLL